MMILFFFRLFCFPHFYKEYNFLQEDNMFSFHWVFEVTDIQILVCKTKEDSSQHYLISKEITSILIGISLLH